MFNCFVKKIGIIKIVWEQIQYLHTIYTYSVIIETSHILILTCYSITRTSLEMSKQFERTWHKLDIGGTISLHRAYNERHYARLSISRYTFYCRSEDDMPSANTSSIILIDTIFYKHPWLKKRWKVFRVPFMLHSEILLFYIRPSMYLRNLWQTGCLYPSFLLEPRILNQRRFTCLIYHNR